MKETTNGFEFKGSTKDEAIQKGLNELGLSLNEVDVEVKSYGGIFSKAAVIITPKPAPAPVEPAVAAKEEMDYDMPIVASHEEEVSEELLQAAETTCVAFLENLLEKMHVSCEVTSIIEDGEVDIFINGAGVAAVIGYRGEVLDAIQYLTLALANREIGDFIRVQVDAGNYRQKRKETLAALAERLARKAAKTGRRTALEPMNPFERRVIHTTLMNDRFVSTESEGEGRNRHVVIVPRNSGGQDRGRGEGNSYGNTGFNRKGPARTRSFGYNGKKF